MGMNVLNITFTTSLQGVTHLCAQHDHIIRELQYTFVVVLKVIVAGFGGLL
jgi:hypothetical protein